MTVRLCESCKRLTKVRMKDCDFCVIGFHYYCIDFEDCAMFQNVPVTVYIIWKNSRHSESNTWKHVNRACTFNLPFNVDSLLNWLLSKEVV